VKRLLLSIVLVACLAAGASAHNGMLALFSGSEHIDCFKAIGTYQTAPIQLWYARGDGPYLGQGVEFKLLKSSPAAVFFAPTWAPAILTDIIMGTIETGISLISQTCFPAGDYIYIGTIPVFNISDPDTFTVKVVPDPQQVPEHAIVIALCLPYAPLYVVQGGTFVFNGGCYSPLDPFGTVAVKETTWGAIKELYR
jgi:hypothetical protein